MTDTSKMDRSWFRDNPRANFRVRAPGFGEVEELAQSMLPPGVGLADGLPAPSADTFWSVLVVRLPMRRIARILTLAPLSKDKEAGFVLMPIALRGRLALS